MVSVVCNKVLKQPCVQSCVGQEVDVSHRESRIKHEWLIKKAQTAPRKAASGFAAFGRLGPSAKAKIKATSMLRLQPWYLHKLELHHL